MRDDCKFTSLLFCLLFFTGSSVAKPSSTHRSALQLGEMIYCTHGWTNQIFPFKAISKYIDYGCFCGKGGSGTPQDSIDRCCFHHDKCYEDVFNKYKLKSYISDVYFKEYQFECDRNTKSVTCEELGSGFDLKSDNLVQYNLCVCDKILSECFATYQHEYNDANRNLDSQKCKNKNWLNLNKQRLKLNFFFYSFT